MYDSIGNVTSVKEYDYTTEEALTGTYTEQTFTYGDSSNPDKLTVFGGKAITYDSLGRPTSYDGKKWTWTKDKLARVYQGSSTQYGTKYETCSFDYDAYGRRIRKYYNYDNNPGATDDYSYSYTTTYDYDSSGRLIHEKLVETMTYSGGSSSTREFVYLYDESGIIGVLYGTSMSTLQPYYFHRNLQGDVIAIYDKNGNRKVEYTYDAYGNCSVVYGFSHELAQKNPIRYRGYYYDRETKLYYLNARYYNPEWRRFISPDSTDYIDPDVPNGLNLYAYCNNDPVNYADPSGHSLTAILVGTVIGALIGFGTTAYFDYRDDGKVLNGSISAQSYIANTIVGAVIGALIGAIGSSTFTVHLPKVELLQAITPDGFILENLVVDSVQITVQGTTIVGTGILAGLGIALFSKASSGPIRFSDGTGIDPQTGKPVTEKERAYEIYKSLDDAKKKNNWKKWMKGKKWRTNHLK